MNLRNILCFSLQISIISTYIIYFVKAEYSYYYDDDSNASQTQCTSSSTNNNCQQNKSEDHKQQITKKKYNWDLDDSSQHKCNIDKITVSEMEKRFATSPSSSDGQFPSMFYKPMIIVSDYDGNNNTSSLLPTPSARHKKRHDQLEIFRQKTTVDGILDSLSPTFELTLSSVNSFSSHRRKIFLGEYLKSEILDSVTLPDQLSNETYTLFGDTFTSDWIQFMKGL